jgi:hypothetical protein
MSKTAVFLAFFACSLFAADMPDVTGTWVCDVKQSKMGKTPPVQSMTLQVDRKTGDVLHSVQTIEDTQGSRTFESDWFMDGKVHPMEASKMTTMSKWDGNALVAERKMDDGSYSESIHITFSPDGKTATEHITSKSPNGNNSRTLVWHKK